MQRSKTVAGLTILIQISAVILAGCSPGGLFSGKMLGYPTRNVPITAAAAQEAFTILSEPQPENMVHITESQFSSLLSQQIQPGIAEPEPLITVWFEPGVIYLQATLPQGIVPGIPTATSLNFVGNLAMTEDNLQVTLEQAGVGIFPAMPAAVLSVINEQIAEMLNSVTKQQMPLDIFIEEGLMTIHLRSGDDR